MYVLWRIVVDTAWHCDKDNYFDIKACIESFVDLCTNASRHVCFTLYLCETVTHGEAHVLCHGASFCVWELSAICWFIFSVHHCVWSLSNRNVCRISMLSTSMCLCTCELSNVHNRLHLHMNIWFSVNFTSLISWTCWDDTRSLDTRSRCVWLSAKTSSINKNPLPEIRGC